MTGGARSPMRGFTLIEVMVALVIVAFGMGAVLAALSSAATNIAALHDKTLAEWIALNRVADARLNLQLPTAGVTEGDLKAFGNADWHWQQDIEPVPAIPGLLEIVVRVRRTGTSVAGSSSSSGGSSSARSSRTGTGLGSSTSSSGGSLFDRGSVFASSSGSGGLGLSSGSSGALGSVSTSISKLTSGGKDQNWLAAVVGFRGDAVAAASGEAPDWTGTSLGSSSSSSSSSSGGASILNPGTSGDSGTLTGSSSGGTGSTTGSGSSGAN